MEKRKNEKQKVFKNSKCAYTYIPNTYNDCVLLHDKAVLSAGRMPQGHIKPQLS